MPKPSSYALLSQDVLDVMTVEPAWQNSEQPAWPWRPPLPTASLTEDQGFCPHLAASRACLGARGSSLGLGIPRTLREHRSLHTGKMPSSPHVISGGSPAIDSPHVVPGGSRASHTILDETPTASTMLG